MSCPGSARPWLPTHDGAYDYLPRSVLEFPDGQAMLDLLAARGLTELEQYPLTGGIATLYVGTKPAASSQPESGAERMTRPALAIRDDLVVAMTGASGAPYAVRLLQVLGRMGRTVHLTISPSAAQVLREELGLESTSTRSIRGSRRRRRRPAASIITTRTSRAGIASGSFPTGGMVIIPCSMSTLGAIAGGITTNLITRAADVHLKERRKLILVPRETPLSLIHLENMVTVTRAGAVVLPAMPGWYHRPRRLDDLIDFVVGAICDQFGIHNALSPRWGNRGPSDPLDETTGSRDRSRTRRSRTRSRSVRPMPCDGELRRSSARAGSF